MDPAPAQIQELYNRPTPDSAFQSAARRLHFRPVVRIQKIDSLELPELAPYRTLRRQQEHRDQGIFVAEGEKVVRRLLESDLAVDSLLLPPKWLDEYESLLHGRPGDVRLFVAPKDVLENLTGFSMYQGVLALARVPRSPDLDTLLAGSPPPRLFAAIEGLSNAQNVGALVRNCAAFGVQGLLVSRTSASPFLRRAVRSSMGTVFRLPVLEGLPLAAALSDLSRYGVRSVAAHPRPEAPVPASVDFTTDCCLVFGGEGCGLPPETLAACNGSVAVPMAGGVDSLNVGNAAAVLFYEARRQRAGSLKG